MGSFILLFIIEVKLSLRAGGSALVIARRLLHGTNGATQEALPECTSVEGYIYIHCTQVKNSNFTEQYQTNMFPSELLQFAKLAK